MKRFRKFAAIILSFAMLCANLGYVPQAKAEAETNTVILTPFEGQWKYYGQTRTFLENEHYTLSDEVDSLNVKWKLALASEEVGHQPFVFEYEVNGEETSVTGSAVEGVSIATGASVAVSGSVITIAENAPTFEIRAYTTTAKVAEKTTIYTSTASQTLEAPDGYLISGEKVNGEWNWQEEIETGELKEGNNVITYYLRSIQQNNTKYAIDQTPKTTTIKVDSIAPTIQELSGGMNCTDVYSEGSITGSEAGKYYYMVLPANSSQTVTKDIIRENVATNYGIVGYGRLDGTASTYLQFQNLVPETSYIIYAFLVDDAGNESELSKSEAFSTAKMLLNGEVEVVGKAEVGQTLTAQTEITSVDPGELSYQWYRVKLDADEEEFEEEYEDIDEEEYEDDEEDEDEESDEEYEEDEEYEDDELVEIDDEEDTEDIVDEEESEEEEEIDVTTLDGATMITDATTSTYQVTKDDIGYRILVKVTAQNYSSYIMGDSDGFVPKLIPTYTKPTFATLMYSPTRTLASYALPTQWSWVDDSVVPEYENSGYRAKFTPEDTKHYKTVIVSLPISVTKKSLTKKMFMVSKTRAYTGGHIRNNFKAKDGKTKLVKGKDFSVTYKNNKKLGKATITFKGIGSYKGTIKATYTIKKRSIKNLYYEYKAKKVYKGKPINAKITILNTDNKLKKNRDYTMEYRNNVEVGKVTVVIKGKGNYYGKKTIRFQIVPKKPIIKKAKVKGRTLTITMKENQYAKGFYVYVSTTKNFKKATTQTYVAYDTKLGLKKLKKGRYYIRSQAYWTKKGKVYVSGYSKKKSVKVK